MSAYAHRPASASVRRVGRRLGAAALLWLALLGSGRLSAAEQMRVQSDDPGCVGKVSREICTRMDGGGGICGPALCPGDRPCLHCMPTSIEGRDSPLWVPMVIFGAAVAVVGFVFWFRMSKRFDG